MNSTIEIGNLTTDVRYNEVNVGGVNTPRATFGLAVNTGSGERQTTDYFTVTCWRQLAQNCANWLKKGRKVAVHGSVHLSTYVAQNGANTGKQVYYMSLQASNIEFLSPREREDATAGTVAQIPAATAPAPATQPTPAPAMAPAMAPATAQTNQQPQDSAAFIPLNEEDLPF